MCINTNTDIPLKKKRRRGRRGGRRKHFPGPLLPTFCDLVKQTQNRQTIFLSVPNISSKTSQTNRRVAIWTKPSRPARERRRRVEWEKVKNPGKYLLFDNPEKKYFLRERERERKYIKRARKSAGQFSGDIDTPTGNLINTTAGWLPTIQTETNPQLNFFLLLLLLLLAFRPFKQHKTKMKIRETAEECVLSPRVCVCVFLRWSSLAGACWRPFQTFRKRQKLWHGDLKTSKIQTAQTKPKLRRQMKHRKINNNAERNIFKK